MQLCVYVCVCACVCVCVCVCVCIYVCFNLARLLAKAESDTEEPQMGRIPLQRVLAFCRVALSHSSRERANLSERREGGSGDILN